MNKRIFTFLIIVFFAGVSAAQNAPVVPDTAKNDGEDKLHTSGIAVSPSSLRMNVKPGTSQTKEIRVTNDTKNTYKFKIGYSDFKMGRNGKPEGVTPANFRYGLSKWISTTPSYFELKPGIQQKITVTVTIPDNDSSYLAAWTVLMIDQVTERSPLDANPANPNTVALGITPSIGFGVYIYQNPPGVKANKIEIKKITYQDTLNKKSLHMEVMNSGDGIGFCTSYAELTHLETGKQTRLQIKKFTILPGFYRDFSYDLPADLPKGKYSAVGVVDMGGNNEIQAAELDVVIR